MKCPTCGTENKSTNRACYRCGTAFPDSGVHPKGNVNSLWYGKNPAEHKDTVTPPFWGDKSGTPSYGDKSDFIVLHDESSDENAAQDIVRRGAPVPDNRKKLERVRGRKEVDVIVPAAPPPPERKAANRRFRVNWRKFAFSALAVLILCVGVGFGVYYIYKVAVGALSPVLQNRNNQADTASDPEVKKVLINGVTWHKITFFGNDGDVVLVSDPKRSLPIQKGTAELMLNDEDFVPQNLAADKVTVALQAVLVTKDGKEKKLHISSFDIEVPLAPLKLILPAEASTQTDADSIIVRVKVAPGSDRVQIGSNNVTDKVDKNGYVSASVQLEPDKTNTISITVQTKRYRKNTFELRVDRPLLGVAIQLPSESNETKTSNSTILIKGTTEAGATISTTAKLNGHINQDKSGSFSFIAVLKQWGWNDIPITTTDAAGRTATMVHRVYHTPTLASYSRNAWALDYGYITGSTKSLVGQAFQLNGLVISRYESDLGDYYLFDAGTPGQPMPLVVENLNEDPLKMNQYYQLFADVTGTFDKRPLLTIRFRNELPMPSGYGTGAPETTTAGTPSPSPSGSPK